eukprot:TRINITY_DN2188_c0_g1_i3.p1 TRINITY_DN2188_c0_g1~~TRINITY_DN2188_c0_g1_i3.p1  ORF type:complete len:147 (-),score=33.26 TRINITY_DN2188_c0_g1_i3:42-482(-)
MLQVQVDSDGITAFTQFKQSKLKDASGAQVTWVLLAFDNPKEPKNVVISASGTGDFNEFVEALPERDARYGLFNMRYQTKTGGDRAKISFLVWAPDSSPVKARMLIASNKETVKTQLEGVAIEFQASKRADVVLSDWVDKALTTLK